MPRELVLRSEDPPDDTTIVVRAGVGDAESVLQSLVRMFETYGVLGVSVEAVIGQSIQATCAGRRLAVYRRVRLSTFGRLRSAGFALLASFEHPHFTIVLPDVAELTVIRMLRCFDPPIANPGRRW